MNPAFVNSEAQSATLANLTTRHLLFREDDELFLRPSFPISRYLLSYLHRLYIYKRFTFTSSLFFLSMKCALTS